MDGLDICSYVFFSIKYHEDVETTKYIQSTKNTLQETNISPQNGILKMIFLFPRWDMLIPWRVFKAQRITTNYTPIIFTHGDTLATGMR